MFFLCLSVSVCVGLRVSVPVSACLSVWSKECVEVFSGSMHNENVCMMCKMSKSMRLSRQEYSLFKVRHTDNTENKIKK